MYFLLLMIGITTFIFCLCYILCSYSNTESLLLASVHNIIVIILSIVLFVALIALPIERLNSAAFIQQHQVVQQTIDSMRENEQVTYLERIRLSEDIIEINKETANRQFYAAHPWFSIYQVPGILKLKPIE